MSNIKLFKHNKICSHWNAEKKEMVFTIIQQLYLENHLKASLPFSNLPFGNLPFGKLV